MIKLEKLKELLVTGVLLSNDTFTVDDIDTILDNRNEDIFNNEWMRNYNQLKKKMGINSEEINKMAESIREISYKITYNVTQSPELAGYVSDDFGLIADALILEYNDDWLNALTKEYTKGRIPHNSLKPIKGQLEEIVFNGSEYNSLQSIL